MRYLIRSLKIIDNGHTCVPFNYCINIFGAKGIKLFRSSDKYFSGQELKSA